MKRIIATVVVAAAVTSAVGALAGSASAESSMRKGKNTKLACLAVTKRDSFDSGSRAYLKAENAGLAIIEKHRDAFPKSIANKALATHPGLEARVNAFSTWCHDQGYYG